jgi:hypothetical protein
MPPYKGQYPVRVACGGRFYRAHSPGQLDTLQRVLEQGRFDDADRLFCRWESAKAVSTEPEMPPASPASEGAVDE